MKKTLGRPKLPKEQVKQVFAFRLSEDEQNRIKAAADKASQKPREWARKTLLGAC